MARRGENIYHRKDGRWEGRYIKGRKPDGKPRFGSVYGRSYGEVKKRLLPLKAAFSEQNALTHCSMPFGEFLLTHLAQQRTGRLKPSSYDSYYRIVHNHLMPVLGNVPMHRLSALHAEQLVSGLYDRGLSDGTVRNIFRYLCSAVKRAVKLGILEHDVCADIVLPKAKAKTVHALSIAEQKRLEGEALQALAESDTTQGLEVILALYTGMRVGEICALRWEDVDFEDRVIHVNHTMQRLNLHSSGAKTAVRLGTPKSDSSLRKIPMSPQLARLLLDLRAHSRGDFVLTGRRGHTEPRAVQYRFEKMLQRANVPCVGFHALRHSFATRCMEQNIDVATISKLLGHSSAKLTLDVYTDSLFEHRRAAICKLHSVSIA